MKNHNRIVSRATRIVALAMAVGCGIRQTQGQPGVPEKPSRLLIIKAASGDIEAGRTVDVTERLRAMAKPESLTVAASDQSLDDGDPAQGSRKQLRIEYTFDGKPSEVTIEDGQTVVIGGEGAKVWQGKPIPRLEKPSFDEPLKPYDWWIDPGAFTYSIEWDQTIGHDKPGSGKVVITKKNTTEPGQMGYIEQFLADRPEAHGALPEVGETWTFGVWVKSDKVWKEGDFTVQVVGLADGWKWPEAHPMDFTVQPVLNTQWQHVTVDFVRPHESVTLVYCKLNFAEVGAFWLDDCTLTSKGEAAAPAPSPAQHPRPRPAKLPELRVSESRRFLVQADGRPFVYLGDTAWELFHRLNREEAKRYLEDRASKGFTVIQAVALAELDGLNTPNAYGHRPLVDNDPLRPDVKDVPDNDYWDHVDFIVRRANELGLYIGFLPTWGSHWHKDGGKRAVIFTAQNARTYGEWLGRRYRDAGLVWILGGDKFVGDDEERHTLEAMAQGLKEGDGGAHLITFHPIGQYSSAIWFHDAPWLDFNMVQTGHTRDRDNHTSVLAEYGRTPVKPVLDGEPGYENIPHGFQVADGRLEAIHARRFCYWALFSGAFGHTYGCNEVWQMWAPGRQPLIGAERPWHEAINLPGAGQMRHARALIESGPYFDRMPDPSMVAPPNTTGSDYVAACRAPDARYALIYFPSGKPATIRTFLLKGPRIAAQWFDPRSGERREAPPVEIAPWKTTEFKPPVTDQDWVLVLDTPSTAYPAADQL